MGPPLLLRMDLKEVASAFQSHENDFVAAYVFGSVAAGSTDEYSDIDVLIVRYTDSPFFDRIREIMDLRREFGAADFLIYTPQELESMLLEQGRYFVKEIINKGYSIEGKQKRGRPLAQPG
jgi:predicted nucleotidyltransferase